MYIRVYTVIIFLIGLIGIGEAQVSMNLDSIVISSSRIPQTARQTGRNVTIINSKQIAESYATSLDDLLQYVTGVEVQSRSSFGVQGDISMRGSTYTQVLVLVDGMKLNDPLTAHFNSYIPVSMAEIAQIEVLRGAAAAMYGADAVGGVINIITKGSILSDEGGTQEIQGEYNMGDNRLIQANQGWGIQKDRFYFGGGVSITQSDGEHIAPMAVDGTALDEYDSYFDVKTIGMSAGYKWADGWQLNARMAYDYREFAARYFYTTSTFDKSTEITRNWWNQIRLSKIGDHSSTDVNVSYKYNTDVFVFSPDFPSTNRHVSKLWNLNVGHLIELSPELSLRIGGQADRRSVASTDRGDHSDMHYGIYAVSMIEPIRELFVTSSIRLDHDDNFGVEFTPQLNVSYGVGGSLVLRGSVGRSIRAADYTERYVSYNLANLTPGRSLGNPNLEAERAWSQELGLDITVNKNWKIKTTVFLRQSSQLIDYIPTIESEIPNNTNLQAGETYLYASNIAAVDTKGLEVESILTKRIGEGASLRWSLGYTHLNTTSDEGLSIYLSNHARHLVVSQLALIFPQAELSLSALFKSRTPRIASGIDAALDNNYQVWNSRFRYHISKNISGQVQVHNLWDAQYQDILGAPMPGRWMSAGVKISL